MPRQGKTTIKNTTVPDLTIKLIDKFIETRKNQFAFLKLSRAKVVEIAFFKFLESRDELEPLLKELGVSDSEAKSIKRYLEAVT